MDPKYIAANVALTKTVVDDLDQIGKELKDVFGIRLSRQNVIAYLINHYRAVKKEEQS